MSSNIRKVVGSFIFGAVTVAGVQAQNWSFCLDGNTPYSPGYSIGRVSNELLVAAMGFSGTANYNGPCFPSSFSANARGRIGFSVGSLGSVQSTFDDNMTITFGMNNEPVGSWGYATTNRDGTRTLFGANGFSANFVGLSDRYIYAETRNDDVLVKCRIDVIGDAARIQWDLTNDDTESHTIGLWFGQYLAMLSGTPDPATGSTVSGGPTMQKIPYVYVPTEKPVLRDKLWQRSGPTAATFPSYVKFNFGQSSAYGLRVENSSNTTLKDATNANEFVVGDKQNLMGPNDGSDQTFSDAPHGITDTSINDAGFIQKFNEQAVAPGGTRRIVQYMRSTWGVSDYVLPYTAVVDAPRMVSTEDDGTNSDEENGLFKNPFTIRVYIDNVGGYSDIDRGFNISDVKIKLTIPNGLNFPGFATTVRNRQLLLSSVKIREIKFVDFTVEADGIEFGDLPYKVEISSIPGPSKVLNGSIQVAATPRYRLFDNGGPTANAITTPFQFTDSSWDTVLGLSSPSDYQAFEWDPQAGGYIISTSAARGRGVFVINNTGALQSNPLGGNPVTPPDTAPNPGDNVGRVVVQLKKGWNLIGNPYNYPITIGQLNGVSAAAPSASYAWDELVRQGRVNSSISYWNAATQTYKFLQQNTDQLLPNTAYWIYVNNADLSLSFPPVFAETLPGSSRSSNDWTQTDKQWRLQLVARSNNSIDDQNFIGVAKSAQDANQLRYMEPPMAPTQGLGLSIEGQSGGQVTRLAQNLSDRQGRQEFKVFVQSEKAGEVNVTWPNMSSVPKNVRFRLVDVATNTSRDMRSSSGYSFQATANSTREFKVQVDLGGQSRAVIATVNVTRGGSRASNAPFAINYTLSSSATTTIRILGAGGKEIYTVTRGRADNAGENTATWNLKDNANRAVAPGTYQVEIIATTPEGENVRRYVPVNVIR